MRRPARSIALGTAMVLAAGACGGDETSTGEAAASEDTASEDTASEDTATEDGETSDLPVVVVTTNILGDVAEEVLGDQAEVVTIMPPGSDPHDFQASAQQANTIREADALMVNGGGFEEGLLDVIEGAERDGVATFEALEAVETIEFGEKSHHDDGEEHGDEEEHDHSGADPHFFTDPVRMAEAAEAMVDFIVEEVDGIDVEAIEASGDAYVQELTDLDASISSILDPLGEDERVLVTNHEVFGYFADRYDFEVVGTIIPTATTSDAVSPADLASLADTVRDEGVAAIFADTSSSDDLAETLASEVGDVAVVELFSESLGNEGSEGATYIEMVRTNAERIAEGLGA